MSEPGTQSTLLQALDADPDRAEDKYEQLFVQLRSYFRSRHPPIAEDLAMETLSRGFSRLQAGVNLTVDPIHYFRKIAKNVAIEKWRKKTPALVPLDDEHPDRTREFSRIEARIYLDQCLSRLSAAEREILVRYQDEDHVELARSLGIQHTNLRVKYLRAKRRLAKLMRGERKRGATRETKVVATPLKESEG